MKFQLPSSKTEAVIRDYIPHGVHAKVQGILTRNLKVDFSSLNPTKEQLLQEFGKDEMESLDALTGAEYDKALAQLNGKYVTRQIKVEQFSLESAEEANVAKVEGMTISLNGKPATREDIDNLPESDYQLLLQRINEIEQAPLDSGSSEPSAK